MQFTDLSFLIVYLPILLVIFYLVKPAYRQWVVLFMSLVFYAFGSPVYLVPLCLSILLNIGLAKGIFIQKKNNRDRLAKILLVAGIVWNVSVFIIIRYYDSIKELITHEDESSQGTVNILIPLGLSYFTFKTIAYLVDVYKKDAITFSFLDAAVYLSFFPQIQSGPISRYDYFALEKQYTPDYLYKGIVRFMIGFSKKVILANTLYNIVTEVFDGAENYSTAYVWLGVIVFELYLYYDFCGYSDMAIGLGNMLGIPCPENFDYPYMSKSFSEFWRRWHMTLGSWFKDYVYIPMGGSRKGKVWLYINLFVVWLLTGLWHGTSVNYILWGIVCFVFISFERITNLPKVTSKNKIASIIYRIVTLLFISIMMAVFKSETISQIGSVLKGMFIYSYDEIYFKRAVFLLKDYSFFIILALIFVTPVVRVIENRSEGKELYRNIYNVASGVFVISAFIIALSFVISGQNSPFLYGNF